MISNLIELDSRKRRLYAMMLSICLSVCLFDWHLWNLLSYSLDGSTWRRERAYRIDSHTLVIYYLPSLWWIKIIICTESSAITSSLAAGFGRHGMPPPASNPDFWPFDLETDTRVASNVPSKFEHARPLGSRIVRYVRDGRTDRRTDGQKQCLLPLPYGRGMIIFKRFSSARSCA